MRTITRTLRRSSFVVLWMALIQTGCPSKDSENKDSGELSLDGGRDLATLCKIEVPAAGCMPEMMDYQPRVNMSKDDTWPACTNDDGTFHLLGAAIPGSAARVAAFEDVGKLLWNNPRTPTTQNFLDARNIYATMNGLGSRVERRQDLHYADIPGNNKTRCNDAGIPQMYPDRCAGPTKLVPLLNDAFQKGLAGNEVLVQAARIEAGLLSWLFLSLLSETWTCSFEALDDCDGEWSHFNGAKPRGEGIGLAAYVKAVSRESYDRMFDATLAAGCWRQIDAALPAARMDLYQRVQSQIDRASLHGVAAVIRQRIASFACDSGESKRAHHAFVTTLGQFLVKPATDRNQQKGMELKAQLSLPVDRFNATTTDQLVNELFPCP